MSREYLEKRRPVGLIRLIGRGPIGIQDGDDRITDPQGPGRGIAGLAVSRELRQLFTSVPPNTLTRPDCLNHGS
jgi:hypothetical protein